jgi:dolichol-phosphate mannosyltransferase
VIYFVLPIYNEEKNIEPLLTGIKHAMTGEEYRVIAVNDGSRDGSIQVLQRLADNHLIIESYRINMNIGAVFSTGINRALAEAQSDDDVLVIMESDRTSTIELVKLLIASIRDNGKDVAIASRYQPGGKYVNFPIGRRILSFGASMLMQRLFPIPGVQDYTIFFRAYRTGILRTAVSYFGKYGLIQSKGFVANAELLIKLSLLTQKIVEVPFIYDYGEKYGASKITIFHTMSEYYSATRYLRRLLVKYRTLPECFRN